MYGGSQSADQRTLDKLRRMFDLFVARSLIDRLGFKPMHLACVVPFSQSLDTDPVYADLDQEDNTGRTALSWVAQRGNPRLLNALLLCQADFNRRDSSGRNTLHWAVLGRNVSCVEGLIEFGADIFAKDKLGSTPIHLAVQGEASLLIVQTLLSHGADLRARDGQGMTPLHVAAYYDQPSIVSRLLGNGASINDKDPDPWAWYDTFTELNMRIRRRTTGQMTEQSADEDPHSWESLEKDLAGLGLFEDEEITHELESEDEWDDALEVLSSNSNQGATSSTTSMASPNAKQRKPRSDDPSDEIY